MAVKGIVIPKEKLEGQKLTAWARQNYLIKKLFFKINNEGSKNSLDGWQNQLEGVLAGVSVYFLPLPKGKYHGLFLELKRTKGGKVSALQVEWVKLMRENGYAAGICYGADHAIEVIERYLKI